MTLLLSLPLAQKIHQLIVASRQIEGLARGWFNGSLNEGVAERRMSALELQYDELRNEVECELESAWVNAGFVPADLPSTLPTFPPSHKAPGAHSVKPVMPTQAVLGKEVYVHPQYTVDKALKRKRDEEKQRANKREKQSVDEEEVHYGEPVQPIGLQTCMIPLKWGEKKRMRNWNWNWRGTGKGGRVEEECVSPMGTVMVF